MYKTDEKKIGPIGLGIGALALVAMVTVGTRLPAIPVYAAAMAVLGVMLAVESRAHRRAGHPRLSNAGRVVAALFILAAIAALLSAYWEVLPPALWIVAVITATAGYALLTGVEFWLRRRGQ
jgi:uncharacterized membrane protein YfcA